MGDERPATVLQIQQTIDAMDPRGHRAVGWSILVTLARSELRRGRSVILDGVCRAAATVVAVHARLAPDDGCGAIRHLGQAHLVVVGQRPAVIRRPEADNASLSPLRPRPPNSARSPSPWNCAQLACERDAGEEPVDTQRSTAMIRQMSVDCDASTPPAGGCGAPGHSVVHDPRALRALAHPVRLAILNFLRTVDSATASECAAALGVGPSACSFHLRSLERFGLVEEDPDGRTDGRRRPWRARPVQLSVGQQGSEEDNEGAFRAWQVMRSEVEAARLRSLERDAEYPDEWRRAIGSEQRLLTVTADELLHLRWAISHLCDGVANLRRAGVSGAHSVDIVIDYVPRFSPEEAKDVGGTDNG